MLCNPAINGHSVRLQFITRVHMPQRAAVMSASQTMHPAELHTFRILMSYCMLRYPSIALHLSITLILGNGQISWVGPNSLLARSSHVRWWLESQNVDSALNVYILASFATFFSKRMIMLLFFFFSSRVAIILLRTSVKWL